MRASAIKSLLAVLLFGVSLLPGLCFAQVQLPTVNLGLTNFEDGFASPGWILQEFPDYYGADKLKDARGATIPGSNHLMTFATTTHVVYVTQQRLLGGWLSFEALQPWVHLHVDLANGPSLNGYQELDVHNRAQGFNVTLRLTKAIPSLPRS